jgi:hypothetical protein
MKKLLFAAVVCIICTFDVHPVYAQGRGYTIPEGKIIQHEGVEVIVFDKDEYHQLGLAYIELNRLLRKAVLTETKYTLRLEIEKSYEMRVENCQGKIKLVEYDRDFWKLRVDDLKKERLSLQKSRKLTTIAHWALHGILSVALIPAILK